MDRHLLLHMDWLGEEPDLQGIQVSGSLVVVLGRHLVPQQGTVQQGNLLEEGLGSQVVQDVDGHVQNGDQLQPEIMKCLRLVKPT